MNQKQISTLLTLTLALLSLQQAFAQNGIEERSNIKASHSSFQYFSFRSHFYQLEYNRGITRFIEVGTYLSTYRNYYPTVITDPITNEQWIGYSSNRAFNYGIQTNIHPLQLLLSEGHRFRLDLYFNAKVGGRYSPAYDNSVRSRGHFFEYDIGAGLAYHLFKHWGLFIEYNYRSPAKFKYGLSIKF